MMKCLHVVLLCMLSLSLTACGSLSTTSLDVDAMAVAKAPHGTTLKDDVDALVKPMVDTGYTPGVIVGVLLPDHSVHFYGYGVADEATGAVPTGDTLFAVGSLSKGFLAGIVAQLVDEKKLAWTDTLETLLPPSTPLSDDAKKVTLLQLATHTSGMPRQPMTPQTLSYFVEYLFDGESFYRHFDTDYVLHYLADFTADHPGTPQYSNIGYGLLSIIAERRTGLSIDTLLAQKMVNPLGMSCTGYDPEILPCNTIRAHGYAGDQPKLIKRGDPTPDWEFTHLMRGSAALHSTARDLLKFAAAHIDDNNHRDRVLARNMDVVYPRTKEAAAKAWIVDDLEGEPLTYQIGIVAGYTSYIGIDNARKTAVVVMQNSFNWDNSVGHKLLLSLRYRMMDSAFLRSKTE